jgi:NAD-dependent SIR2 family protein deacetylase
MNYCPKCKKDVRTQTVRGKNGSYAVEIRQCKECYIMLKLRVTPIKKAADIPEGFEALFGGYQEWKAGK